MFKTDYPEVDAIINELSSAIQQVLGSQLKGIYLFGSLAAGGFDLNNSDIDLLAIVKEVVSDADLEKLKAVHSRLTKKHPDWEGRIEVAYVSVEGMKNFKTKATKIARISPGEPLNYREMNIDWLMDWHMVQEQGITVLGPSPQDFIPHITSAEYIESLKKIMQEHQNSAKKALHKGYQAYIVMAFCRNLYAIKHGQQISKPGGIKWAVKEYPKWGNFINEASSWRGLADKSDSPETQKQTIEFVEFVMKEINEGSSKN